jgi:hypothetical protein
MKSNDAGKNFLAALEKGKVSYPKESIVEVTNEDSIRVVTETLKSVYNQHESAEWIINLTGGTKPMSIAVYEFFKDKNVKLIYVNNPKPNVFLDLMAETSIQCTYRPSAEEFLDGYGFEYAKTVANVQKAEERAKRCFELSCLFAANAKSEDLFTQLNHNERDYLRKGKMGLCPQLYEHLTEPIRHSIETTFTQKERSCGNKYMGEFLTGGWLEVFFWGLLNHHQDKLELWDCHLGIDIRKKGTTSGTNNEIDVAFMKDHTLSFVECKSGSQNNDKDSDVLYKVETIRKQLGALRVKSYLATTTNNILQDGQIKESFANRASLYHCTIIPLGQICQLAKDWQNTEIVKQVLGFE